MSEATRSEAGIPSLWLRSLTALALSFVGLTGTLHGQEPRAWPADAFLPLTESRIGALPAAERTAWLAYWTESERRAQTLSLRSTKEVAPPGPITALAKGASYSRGLRLDASADWYRSAEAATLADRIGLWQSEAGGWTKGHDYLGGKPSEEVDVWSRGTLDNNATTTELRFLARVLAAHNDQRPAWTAALRRGVDYLLAAQYPNGGFPQIYPLAGGYHDAVTFNDSALLHALELLRSVASGEEGFALVRAAQREEAARRFALGVECILTARIEAADGRRTVWAQQHDPLTLRPCAARNFEPIAASASESTALVLFLMSLEKPSPEVATAIREAVSWFERVAVGRFTWDRSASSGPGLSFAPNAPRLWARLYDVDTDRPVFGDRDRTVHFVVTEISAERRRGYGWYGEWPEEALALYAEWKGRLADSAPHR